MHADILIYTVGSSLYSVFCVVHRNAHNACIAYRVCFAETCVRVGPRAIIIIVCSILPGHIHDVSVALTGFVRNGSVVGVGQVRQVNQAVRVPVGRRAAADSGQIRRLGGAMAAAAQQAVARALQQTARHPADQKEFARAALVLALQLAIDRADAVRMVVAYGCGASSAAVEIAAAPPRMCVCQALRSTACALFVVGVV